MNTYLADTKVYIAGVLMPCIQVTIQSTVNQPPQATIVMPADAKLFDVGRNDRVPVHIFQKDVYGVEADDYTRDYLLLFEGQITARTYISSSFQRAISFQAVGVIAMLDDFRIQYVNQMSDIFQYSIENKIVDAVGLPGIYSFPECFMLQGLPTKEKKNGANAIQFPYEYIENIFAYMTDGHAGDFYAKTAYSIFYSGEAERLKLRREKEEGKRRYLKVPFFDEIQEGKDYVWQTADGKKQEAAVFFPILAGLKHRITIAELSNAFTGQTQKLSTAMDMIKYMLDPLEFEFAMPASPVLCVTKDRVKPAAAKATQASPEVSTADGSSVSPEDIAREKEESERKYREEGDAQANAKDAQQKQKEAQQQQAKAEKPLAPAENAALLSAAKKRFEEVMPAIEKYMAGRADAPVEEGVKPGMYDRGRAEAAALLSSKLQKQIDDPNTGTPNVLVARGKELLNTTYDKISELEGSNASVRGDYEATRLTLLNSKYNGASLDDYNPQGISILPSDFSKDNQSFYQGHLDAYGKYLSSGKEAMAQCTSDVASLREALDRAKSATGIDAIGTEQAALVEAYLKAAEANIKIAGSKYASESDDLDASKAALKGLLAPAQQPAQPQQQQQQQRAASAAADKGQTAGEAKTEESTDTAQQQQASTKEITSLGTCYLKPILSESIPPQCNVIFRSQVLSISANENFARPVTRVRIPDVGTPMSTLRDAGATEEDFLREATTRFYPQEEGVTQEWLSTPEAYKGMTMKMLEMEKYVGPFVQEVGTPVWWNWCRERKLTCADDELEQYTLMQMGLCHRQLLQFRYAQRRLSVSITFDPFIAVGYPAVVFDEEATGLAFAGYVMSVSHNIDNSTQGMTTNIELGFVRLLGEACTMNITHPVQHLQELYHNPEKMTEIYNRLLGKDVPEELKPAEKELVSMNAQSSNKPLTPDTADELKTHTQPQQADYASRKGQMPGSLALTFNQVAAKWAFEEGDSSSPQRSVDEAYKLHRRNICTFKQYMDFMNLHYTEEVITGEEPTAVQFSEKAGKEDCDSEGNPKPEFLEHCYILRRRPIVFYTQAPEVKEQEQPKEEKDKGTSDGDAYMDKVEKMTPEEKAKERERVQSEYAKKEAMLTDKIGKAKAQEAAAEAKLADALKERSENKDRDPSVAATLDSVVATAEVSLSLARESRAIAESVLEDQKLIRDSSIAALDGTAPASNMSDASIIAGRKASAASNATADSQTKCSSAEARTHEFYQNKAADTSLDANVRNDYTNMAADSLAASAEYTEAAKKSHDRALRVSSNNKKALSFHQAISRRLAKRDGGK